MMVFVIFIFAKDGFVEEKNTTVSFLLFVKK